MPDLNKKIVVLCPYCTAMYKVSVSLMGKNVTCDKCKKNFVVEKGEAEINKRDLNNSLLFCKIALNYGFASEKMVEEVLTEYTQMTNSDLSPSVEKIFIEKNFLNDTSVSKIERIIPLWGFRQKEKIFASDAVEKGYITEEKAKEFLVLQAKNFDKTGQVKTIREYMDENAANADLSEDNRADIKEKDSGPLAYVDKDEKEDGESGYVEMVAEGGNQANSVSELSGIRAEIIPEKDLPANKDGSGDTPVAEPTTDIPLKEVKNESSDATDLSSEQPSSTVDKSDLKPEPALSVTEADSFDTEGYTVKLIKGLELSIHPEGIIALLRAPDGIPNGTTVEGIKLSLMEEEIIYGVVDDSMIKGFINSSIFREKPFKIAEGRAPKKGKQGRIDYHFDTQPLKVGAVSDTGEIDFKDRGEIPFVRKGDLLAEIIPSIPGENGKDIYGNDIAVPEIQQVVLRCEEGTESSDDKLKVYAETDGQPKLTIGNALYVLSEMKINGDVGFETGHIEFDGNISISGTVQDGFRVRGANVNARDVMAAEIISAGDVTVLNGITGGTIISEGNVSAKYLNRSKIRSFGNVVVEKEIIDSEIKNSGGCQVTMGKIISSEIFSKQGVEAVEIGTEMSAPSKIRVGVDDHINDEVAKVEEEIFAVRERIDKLLAETEAFMEKEKIAQTRIAELAQVQDRAQLSVNELKEKIKLIQESGKNEEKNVIEKNIELLLEKIKNADEDVNAQFDMQDELLDKIALNNGQQKSEEEKLFLLEEKKKGLTDWVKKQKTTAYVKVRKAVHSGTVVNGSNSSMVIHETVHNVKIKEVKAPHSDSGWEMKMG